jgi:hypothetical protein
MGRGTLGKESGKCMRCMINGKDVCVRVFMEKL